MVSPNSTSETNIPLFSKRNYNVLINLIRCNCRSEDHNQCPPAIHAYAGGRHITDVVLYDGLCSVRIASVHRNTAPEMRQGYPSGHRDHSLGLRSSHQELRQLVRGKWRI